MNTYREIQYFHPLVYAAIGLLILALALLAAQGAATAQPFATSGLLAILAGGLFAMVTVLGRMVVDVDARRLTITFGWLGLVRRTIELEHVDSARVCLFRPLREYLGWGWRYGLDGSVCYTTRGRRGIELSVDGQRHIVGSRDPRQLKFAILPEEAANEVVCEPAEAVVEVPPRIRKVRPRLPKRSNWGMLRPGDLGGESRLI